MAVAALSFVHYIGAQEPRVSPSPDRSYSTARFRIDRWHDDTVDKAFFGDRYYLTKLQVSPSWPFHSLR